VAEIAAVVWAYSNSDKLEGYVESSVRSTVQEEYGVVDTRTKTFDAIQKGVGTSVLFSDVIITIIVVVIIIIIIIIFVHLWMKLAGPPVTRHASFSGFVL
jgi:hypothetical protein